jgi:hypothetical protein
MVEGGGMTVRERRAQAAIEAAGARAPRRMMRWAGALTTFVAGPRPGSEPGVRPKAAAGTGTARPSALPPPRLGCEPGGVVHAARRLLGRGEAA